MSENNKVTRFFSGQLWKQSVKSNLVICIAITLVMILITSVINFARSVVLVDESSVDVTEYQEDFYTYLGAMAAYNGMTGGSLSYDDFIASDNHEAYDQSFEALSSQLDQELSSDGFNAAIEGLEQGQTPVETYVKQFEYAYALGQEQGVFSGDELTISEMLSLTFELMGISSDLMETMSEIDTSAVMNQMYYSIIGPLPIFILIVILANSLIAEQVDRGSMAYVLSTPTKRSAVVLTQMIYMIVIPLIVIALVCTARIGTSFLWYDEVNVKGYIASFAGMYIMVEAVCGICYMGSCLFSRSRNSMGFGGGITGWFFICSLLGMFGSDDMVSTGMGSEELGIFNKLTVIGLYDYEALATVGSGTVDTGFVWKLAVLVGIAIICYAIGAVRFCKKDLPL